MRKVARFPDRVKQQPEKFGVFGFLEQESGQEHLFFDPSFLCDDHEQRQQIQRGRFFARNPRGLVVSISDRMWPSPPQNKSINFENIYNKTQNFGTM